MSDPYESDRDMCDRYEERINELASALDAERQRRVEAEQLLVASRRGHYYCEDSWYSCPKAHDGCSNEEEGDECNCGADEYNARIDAHLARYKEAEK